MSTERLRHTRGGRPYRVYSRPFPIAAASGADDGSADAVEASHRPRERSVREPVVSRALVGPVDERVIMLQGFYSGGRTSLGVSTVSTTQIDFR